MAVNITKPARLVARLRPAWSSAPVSLRTLTSTAVRSKDEQWPQRTPLGVYYESVLNHPPPYAEEKPEDPPNSADPEVLPSEKKPAEPSQAPPPTKKKPGRKPKSDSSASASAASPPTRSLSLTSAQEKARIVFGSRLAGPAEQAERLAMKTTQSTYIAGVLVPPRPEEPDNCCMSGCVNCVWDLYRDELEEWSMKKNEAAQQLAASGGSPEADGGRSGLRVPDAKIVKDLWDEEPMQSIPVGIREFMKMEKKLKERHEQEAALGMKA